MQLRHQAAAAAGAPPSSARNSRRALHAQQQQRHHLTSPHRHRQQQQQQQRPQASLLNSHMLGSMLTSTASDSAAAAGAITDDAASVDNASQDAICLRTRSKHPLAEQVWLLADICRLLCSFSAESPHQTRALCLFGCFNKLHWPLRCSHLAVTQYNIESPPLPASIRMRYAATISSI
jgi:hypothetical protein